LAVLALTRRRTSLWSVLAIVAAVATGLAVFSYLSWLRGQIPVAGKLVPTVVAVADLEPGTVLTGAMLDVVDQPSKYLPPGTLRATSSAIGKVLGVPVFSGEVLTQKKLGSKGGASSVVPPGMRAYSLSIGSVTGLSFIPTPGDRIDVLATFPPEVLGQATTVTILRSKEVASVGESAAAGEKGGGRVASQLGITSPGERRVAITLFVTPQEAERLAMAEALGKITLTLAPSKVEEAPPPAPVTAKDLASS